MSTVNRRPLCKYTSVCCIRLLWGLFACSLGFVWWAVWLFWEQSGVEATTAFSTAQAWPLDRACSVGLLTGMALMHFTAPCDPPYHPPTHTDTHSWIRTHTRSRSELNLAPWFSTVGGRSQKTGVEKEQKTLWLVCHFLPHSYFFFLLSI